MEANIVNIPIFNPCVHATPHQTYWVPWDFDYTYFIPSGSGAYHYQSDKMGCDRFLVDVILTPYSASGIQPGKGEPLGGVLVPILADAYDLPSSTAFGGTTPSTAEDCLRYQLNATFYRKLYQETHFTLLKNFSGLHTVLNSAGQCEPFGSVGIQVHTPDVGLDTYRVAVSCILRNTAQQVQVYFQDVIPA